ncbi:nuclear transport factor 2 family protein [Terricaulis silvestris]|uniref:Ketosteroid isomerase-related protein n=1 Tax=Terricaulis silvestris TaxID=2686094 RepID=A0A6I6MKQ6_9CAUL|nr:nuclear transport factor 2 family protein [Terricaulis silvestris]QGZ95935.1 Ketosteroid isomerase-related protein [Terricaulis silvestris]
MSTEANVAVARQFYDCFSAGDLEGVMATMSEDARFRVPGKPDEFGSAGWYDKAKIRRLFELMISRLKNGLRMEVLSVLADGDRVALEVASDGELENGRRYNNEYFVLFTIANGKIKEVREYNDTLHAYKTWIED